jgi:hypothetical protein
MNETENMIWGLVHIGPQTFIGACCDYPIVANGAVMPKGEVGERLLQGAIAAIDRAFELGKAVFLEPVMELQAPLQQVHQQTPDGERRGIAKSPLPMPYGFTTGRTRLRVQNPTAWTFINEMSEGDPDRGSTDPDDAGIDVDVASSQFDGLAVAQRAPRRQLQHQRHRCQAAHLWTEQ